MTNSEASHWLNSLKNSVKGKYEADEEVQEALDMAISALEQLCKEEQEQPCKNCQEFDCFGCLCDKCETFDCHHCEYRWR